MKKIPIRRLSVVLAVGAFLGGCGPEPGPDSDSPSTLSSKGIAPDEVADGSTVAEAARRNLSERLGQPTDKIQILETRSVYWQSAALGCPDPEKAYAQALTRGWFIRLGVEGTEYRYHASEDGEPFSCDPRRSEAPLDYAVE
jgi:hypothetical protein